MQGTPTLLAEERIQLRSVGIDIGSATTHLLFSRLTLEKVGTRYVTTNRQVSYESPVVFTPYSGPVALDREALQSFIDGQYALAGVERDAVDTGALILTGVALLRDNARSIADIFAVEAGRFVAVSAGDNLEAVMAAHGSGAVPMSQTRPDRLLNIDIGGGTTKFAVCVAGQVEQVCAIDVGARLIVLDDGGIVVRLEPAGRAVAATLGIDLRIGDKMEENDLDRIAEFMVDELLAVLPDGRPPTRPLTLLRGEPLARRPAVGGVIVSGGVSEYVYVRQREDFGDLGPRIADRLRRSFEHLGVELLPASSGIRATVIGASQFTAQLSGSTIYLSGPDVVPLRNVPVIAPIIDFEGELDEQAIIRAIESAIVRFDLVEQRGPLALALRWRGIASFSRLNALARGIEGGLAIRVERDGLVVLVCDDDVGRLIGKHLVDEEGGTRPIVSIDCIMLSDFDFIDVGEIVPGSNVVPVVIKSLMFSDNTDHAPSDGNGELEISRRLDQPEGESPADSAI